LKTYFVDTSFYIVFLIKSDRFHDDARRFLIGLNANFVTTDWVIAELGNALSSLTDRLMCGKFIRNMNTEPNLTIVFHTPELLNEARDLYESRKDKNWSLTDCSSFVVMKKRGISAALTTDRHFIQAGFEAEFSP